MTVLMTGASSGLGLATARALQRAGHTVISGARSFSRGIQDGMHTCPLDVTRPDSIRSFVDYAVSVSPHLDAVIHCAGILVLGSCEDITAEAYASVMDTDFLGMVRINQAVLPIMRRAGHGRIVMFSSINGLLGIPFQSAYTAAKHAVEGYAECLDMELRKFGIQVCLIEPGDHQGGSERCRLHAVSREGSPYAQDVDRGTGRIAHDEAHGLMPDALGRKVARLLERRRMPLRKRIARLDQRLAVVLHDLLPGSAFSWILRRYYLGARRTPSAKRAAV